MDLNTCSYNFLSHQVHGIADAYRLQLMNMKIMNARQETNVIDV